MAKLTTMKPLVHLLLILFSIDTIFAAQAITEADCKDDEKFLECGRCERTCENFDKSLCSTECLPPMCKCETGKIRNSAGKCVFETQCDPTYNPCGANESLTYTPRPWCFASCRDPNPPCLQQQHNTVWTEGCECSKGFIRNNARKCILPSECPKDVNHCDENESLKSSACEPTCQNPDKTCIDGISPSGPICQCSQGFVRNYAGKCVKQTECQIFYVL